MPTIDQRQMLSKVEERLRSETDEVLRHHLELLLQHMRGEAALDVEEIMATIAEDAHYESHGGEPHVLEGRDAVRRFYEQFLASALHRFSFEVDRLVVDPDCIVTEGVMRMAYPGHMLAAMGIEVDDPSASYLYETRLVVLWPIHESGLFVGEISYLGRDGLAGIAERKLDPDDILLYEPASK